MGKIQTHFLEKLFKLSHSMGAREIYLFWEIIYFGFDK